MTQKDDDVTVTIYEGADLEALKNELAEQLFGAPVEAGCCRRCRYQFTAQNVFTAAGWRETELSGLCEKCWDELWGDEGE